MPVHAHRPASVVTVCVTAAVRAVILVPGIGAGGWVQAGSTGPRTETRSTQEATARLAQASAQGDCHPVLPPGCRRPRSSEVLAAGGDAGETHEVSADMTVTPSPSHCPVGDLGHRTSGHQFPVSKHRVSTALRALTGPSGSPGTAGSARARASSLLVSFPVPVGNTLPPSPSGQGGAQPPGGGFGGARPAGPGHTRDPRRPENVRV